MPALGEPTADWGDHVKIGWVGLGMIGTEMVKQLLANRYAVTVFARGSGLADVRTQGAGKATDYRNLATDSDLLVVCVFNDAQVREVLLEQGALASMRPGSVVVIHTTGSPALARELALAAPSGVAVIDATFSGGPHDIQAGALTVMLGGDPAALEQVRPALATYACAIHHVGEVGNGQIIKLLNNLLFATNLMNAAQAIELAGQQGFDAAQIAGIFATCSGASYAMARFEAKLPAAALLDRVRPYLEKDVATAMAAASTSGLDVSAFAQTAQYFRPATKA